MVWRGSVEAGNHTGVFAGQAVGDRRLGLVGQEAPGRIEANHLDRIDQRAIEEPCDHEPREVLTATRRIGCAGIVTDLIMDFAERRIEIEVETEVGNDLAESLGDLTEERLDRLALRGSLVAAIEQVGDLLVVRRSASRSRWHDKSPIVPILDDRAHLPELAGVGHAAAAKFADPDTHDPSRFENGRRIVVGQFIHRKRPLAASGGWQSPRRR